MLSHAITVLLGCQGYDCCFDYAAWCVRQRSCISYPSLGLENISVCPLRRRLLVCLCCPCSFICLNKLRHPSVYPPVARSLTCTNPAKLTESFVRRETHLSTELCNRVSSFPAHNRTPSFDQKAQAG